MQWSQSIVAFDFYVAILPTDQGLNHLQMTIPMEESHYHHHHVHYNYQSIIGSKKGELRIETIMINIHVIKEGQKSECYVNYLQTSMMQWSPSIIINTSS